MQQKQQAISFFQKYLTLWVILCMAAGVAIGHLFPSVPARLEGMQVAGISIPIAVLIWASDTTRASSSMSPHGAGSCVASSNRFHSLATLHPQRHFVVLSI
jgi:hypothetical protein